MAALLGVLLKFRAREIRIASSYLGTQPLEEYRARGHRRLAAKTYDTACAGCVWGCRMPVEITVDHWNTQKKKHRFETFCYGPDDCPSYRAGPKRTVPGRRGMKHVEEIEDRDARGGPLEERSRFDDHALE